MNHHPGWGGHGRPGGARMSHHVEWIVTRTPVRDASCAPVARAVDDHDGDERVQAPTCAHDRETALPRDRVAELRHRVRIGAYDNRAVMEQVARRILQSGDL